MGDLGDYGRRDGDEEDEEDVNDEYRAQKDALLFAIDVSTSMLKKPPPSDDKKADKDSAVLAALKCAYQIMQQRIISNPRDMMGVLLFGTEKTKFMDDGNLSSYPHCYLYTPLDVPSAEDVKRLRSLVEDDEDTEEILTPATEKVPLKDVLFCANQIFTTKAPNFGSRQLYIITDNDDPHEGDKKENSNATVRAKDLYDLSVNIQLYPITRGDEQFDRTKFYDDVIYGDSPADAIDSTGTGTSKLNSLVNKINFKQTPKRAYFSNMAFELGPGFQISVKGYNILQKQEPARTCYIWLDGEKPQIAVGQTSRMAGDSTKSVETIEVKKAYKFGGEYVYFSPEEQKDDIKSWGKPIIRVIGFKDRSLLKFWMSVDKSIFIYPSEEGFVGSTRVFSALWQKLLKSNKIGIAWHIARTNGNPKLVAIIPSGPKAEDDVDSFTAGLWLYTIPFADDVRPAPETSLVRTTDELTDKMNMIVRQLQLPNASYKPTKYPNPALQWHYRILQALALEDEVPEKPDDATVPKYKAINKRCGGYIEEWSQLADEEAIRVGEQKAIKREAEADGSDDEPKPKRQRKTAVASSSAANVDGGSALSDAELKKKVNAEQLSKMKVADLKDALTARGLDSKGLKKDLVDRIEQWVEDNL